MMSILHGDVRSLFAWAKAPEDNFKKMLDGCGADPDDYP
jgi:hypothetical protein